MALADLHIHSYYSEHPSEWFLQRLGAKESYTDPLKLYENCKKEGMNYVTITDHNSIDGALLLKRKYPDDVFVSVESTTYFPEDGCKIHILIFDITQNQFDHIQRIRKNIYDLRDYLKLNNLAYSVAHGTYSINGKLTYEHLEKLILLFDVFEATNGGRNQNNNLIWTNVLKSLNKKKIEKLYNKHKIEPISDNPWVKGFTGGSDDHAGIFLGKTYTFSNVFTMKDFINSIKNKLTIAGGRHNDYKALAFAIYKIAYDFSKNKNSALSENLFSQLSEYVFENRNPSFINRFKINKIKKSKKNQTKIKELLLQMFDLIKTDDENSIERKLDIIFSKIVYISDELLKNLFITIEEKIDKGDLFGIVKNLSSSLPVVFLSLPFFSTLKHMNQGQHLLDRLSNEYLHDENVNNKVILWFTDTINDLNGVSATLKKMGWLASKKGIKNLKIITSIPEDELEDDLPPNIVNIPSVYSFKIPVYENYNLRIPAVLNAISKIYQLKPNEVIISTPGPIGLLGLLVAKLLNCKSSGVYHTDFTLQYDKIDNDGSTSKLIESYTRWFYSKLNHIKVPTNEYIKILSDRGYDMNKMHIFKRGIETDIFKPTQIKNKTIFDKYGISDGFNLLYAGRISRDKNLDFLIAVFNEFRKHKESANLLMIGEGPYLKELKNLTKKFKNIYILGEVERYSLPEFYTEADLFVFPSNSDTFGMVVLECQACGLPAIVSNKGGPQEIVLNNKTGLVAEADNLNDWLEKIMYFSYLKEKNFELYNDFRKNAVNNVTDKYTWDKVFEDLLCNRKKQVHFPDKESVYKIPSW